MSKQQNQFPRTIDGLPRARQTELWEFQNGDRASLTVTPVLKRIGNTEVRMLGYNGSVPGPVLKVKQGSELIVDVRNGGDIETTVHWHGLRLDNRFDGTTATQAPIPVGGTFTYRLTFPDPGVYWYHPHIREDYGQELGLYGNIIVEPAEAGYWPKADREIVLALDDVLIEDGKITPFDRDQIDFTAMGRYGNVLLVQGGTFCVTEARRGETLRFYLTNTANTRVFRVAIPGLRMKLIGGDSGRHERETFVESVTLGPSERAVVDVLLDKAGSFALEHVTPAKRYVLGRLDVAAAAPVRADVKAEFDDLRHNDDFVQMRNTIDIELPRQPDKVLALVAEMNMAEMNTGADHAAGESHDAAMTPGDGIEWEDHMLELNRITTPANTRWKLIDRATAASGKSIDWRFRVGDRVKIRLVNEMNSDHPMNHPFHIHGAGRFLILARDGATEPNFVWKDTVLIPTGQTVDLLLDVTQPGTWMAHCHIAEHHESGMFLSFRVDP